MQPAGERNGCVLCRGHRRLHRRFAGHMCRNLRQLLSGRWYGLLAEPMPAAHGRVLRGGHGGVYAADQRGVCFCRKHLSGQRNGVLAELLSAAIGRVLRRERCVYADDQRRMRRWLPGKLVGMLAESVSATERHVLHGYGRLHGCGAGRVRGCMDHRRCVLAESMSAAHGHMLRGGWFLHNDNAGQLCCDMDHRSELRAGESVSAAIGFLLRGERRVLGIGAGVVRWSVGDRKRVQSEPLPAAARSRHVL